MNDFCKFTENIQRFKNNLLKGIDNTIKFIVYGIIILSLISFPICAFVFCRNYSESFSVFEFIWIFPVLALFLLLFLVADFFQKQKEKYLIITMIIIEIVFSIVLILTYDTEPVSDYGAIWKAANEMANNEFTDELKPSAYMYYYNWQLGIAAFESIIIRLFGSNFLVLKILNILIVVLIDYLVYSLCKSKFGYKISCYAYVLATVFIPWVLSIPQFTNHHIGMLLLILSLWLIDKNKWYTWLLAGISTAVLNILRPMGIIIVLTVACFSIYNLIKSFDIKVIFRLIYFVLAYFVILHSFDLLFISLNYTDTNISEARIPYFKFQKGLYGYNEPYTDLKKFNYNYALYNEEMKKELLSHISNPKDIIVFVFNKMCRYLGLFDYQFEMTYNHDVQFYIQYPVKALYSMSWFQYIGMLLLALCGLKKYFKENNITNAYVIFFIGNTLVYLFIEAFSSYRFESYLFIIIWASIGMDRMKESNIFKNISKKYFTK